jgi:carbamoyl-phosphate synthase large subunit
MNVQFAVKGTNVWVLEVNPRASRTVPFVSKAIGVPLAKLAAKVMTGKKLTELDFTEEIRPPYYSREGIGFPVQQIPRARISCSVPKCVRRAKSWASTRTGAWRTRNRRWPPRPALPQKGCVFISVRDSDKKHVVPLGQGFSELGFPVRDDGTAKDAPGKRPRGLRFCSSSPKAARTCST